MNLNKSLADELNQPTSFPGKFFSQIILALLIQIWKKTWKTPKPLGWAFLKTRFFLKPNVATFCYVATLAYRRH